MKQQTVAITLSCDDEFESILSSAMQDIIKFAVKQSSDHNLNIDTLSSRKHGIVDIPVPRTPETFMNPVRSTNSRPLSKEAAIEIFKERNEKELQSAEESSNDGIETNG